jgi:pyrimidine operon attenuation protein/uracil phosphoribosyltransferase
VESNPLAIVASRLYDPPVNLSDSQTPARTAFMQKILDEKQVSQAVDRLYEIVSAAAEDKDQIAVIGIRTRGETLARRLMDRLASQLPSLEVKLGVLDITLYRDDLSRRRGVPLVRATEIDFDIDDRWLLLVDDVIESGRSIRAALDAIHDFGRPRVIRLAVLIDRGGRQLPIAPDFVGHRAIVEPDRRVQVRLKENDDTEGVFIIKKQDG